jgi:hypothetical protein
MRSPFSFEGALSRRDYAVASILVFFGQHAIAWSALALTDARPLEWSFWINPIRSMAFSEQAATLLLPALALMLTASWLLVALAFRRAREANIDPASAILAAIPVVQILLVVWLSFASRRDLSEEPAEAPAPSKSRTIARGLLIGAALTVGATALSTLVFRVYGYSLFIATPCVIGAVTAYLGRRDCDLDFGASVRLAMFSLLLGGVALLGLAIEGVICLIMASPLIAAMGLLGALLGYAMAGMSGRRSSAASLVLLPLLMVGEFAAPPRASFESVESVAVAASPEAVWDAIVHMGPIPEPPPPPFRWGLAYPMSGEIDGEGVGAVRRGVFSTGVAYERVTEWTPGSKLSFIVLSDPPTMREVSPYQDVLAPHVAGHFRTADAIFTITPISADVTRLTLTTHHDLDLEPAFYWMPFAQWAVHTNKVRVLNHFRQQAEQN